MIGSKRFETMTGGLPLLRYSSTCISQDGWWSDGGYVNYGGGVGGVGGVGGWGWWSGGVAAVRTGLNERR